MTENVGDGNTGGAENEKMNLDRNESHEVDIPIDPAEESKTQLINNGGAGGSDVDVEYKGQHRSTPAASSDGEVSFSGLGKEEVMRYANDPFWVRLRWIMFILFWLGWLVMLVTAIVIIVLAPRCPPRPDLKWYHTETVYQVLPESFKDSNDDGYGDFNGLTSKQEYITNDLGSKAIWLNSVYKTDGKDSGLGIIDHKEINDHFGVTAGKFKSWLKKMRKEGKKVILDLIPNQTSKNHTWFQKSAAGEDKYKDYYVWAPNSGGVPNNWKSVYGGSAWTLDPTRNEYYLHQFSADHPDLNLHNEDVRNEIKDIMKFWFEAGVSGFNIRGLEYLVENPDLTQDNDNDLSETRNYPGTREFLEELREVANSYSDKPGRERVLFGTVRHANKNQTLEYWGVNDKKRLHIVAPIMHELDATCDAKCLEMMITDRMSEESSHWLGLQLGDQDTSRITSRMSAVGNDDATMQRLMVAHAVQLLMPGTPFNYYGDEFGQRDGQVPVSKRVDQYGRDNYRTPMQWSADANAGFTGEGVDPWLPVGKDYTKNHLQAGKAHYASDSAVERFEDLVQLRMKESFQFGKTKVCSNADGLLIFSRKAHRFPFYVVIVNMESTDGYVAPKDLECVESRGAGTVVYSSIEKDKEGDTLDFADRAVSLKPYDTFVVEFEADE